MMVVDQSDDVVGADPGMPTETGMDEGGLNIIAFDRRADCQSGYCPTIETGQADQIFDSARQILAGAYHS